MSPYTKLWLIAFFKTQVVEICLGLWLLRISHNHRSNSSIFPAFRLCLTLFAASAITHPPLWFILPTLRKSWGLTYDQYVILGEFFVLIIEALWYWLILSSLLASMRDQPLRYRLGYATLLSFSLNGASYVMGRYFW